MLILVDTSDSKGQVNLVRVLDYIDLIFAVGGENTGLIFLQLEQSSNNHCQSPRPKVQNIVNIIGLNVPLHFCSFFYGMFELLQPFEVEGVELLHVTPICL